IFLRAELAKYKNEINRLRDSDYYSLVLRLERENVRLTRQNKELSMDRMKLKRTFEKESKAYEEDRQKREIQRQKHIASIELLLKEIERLRTENKQLQYTSKQAHQDIAVEDRRAIENLEIQLSTFTKELNAKVNSIMDTLQRDDTNNVYDNLVKELAERNDEIHRLSIELMEIKNKKTNAEAVSNEKATVSTMQLSELNAKIEKIIAQSIDFEEQLDKKVRILDDLEQQLNQLVIEINANQSM
ncbi:hypothetical protein, partial [Lysinibacillus sphaericus]